MFFLQKNKVLVYRGKKTFFSKNKLFLSKTRDFVPYRYNRWTSSPTHT